MSHDVMDDAISPSHGALPLSTDSIERGLIRSCSLSELALQFNQHSLEPRRQISSTQSPAVQAHDVYRPADSEPVSSTTHPILRRQREFLIRRQNSAANISRISAMVQDILRDEYPSLATDFPLEVDNGSSPSLRSNELSPLQSPTASSASAASSSEDGEVESRRTSFSGPKYRVGKDLRHSESREGVRQYKEIRVRKAIRKRTSTLSNRRNE